MVTEGSFRLWPAGADDRFLSSASSLDKQATKNDGLPHRYNSYNLLELPCRSNTPLRSCVRLDCLARAVAVNCGCSSRTALVPALRPPSSWLTNPPRPGKPSIFRRKAGTPLRTCPLDFTVC